MHCLYAEVKNEIQRNLRTLVISWMYRNHFLSPLSAFPVCLLSRLPQPPHNCLELVTNALVQKYQRSLGTVEPFFLMKTTCTFTHRQDDTDDDTDDEKMGPDHVSEQMTV